MRSLGGEGVGVWVMLASQRRVILLLPLVLALLGCAAKSDPIPDEVSDMFELPLDVSGELEIASIGGAFQTSQLDRICFIQSDEEIVVVGFDEYVENIDAQTGSISVNAQKVDSIFQCNNQHSIVVNLLCQVDYEDRQYQVQLTAWQHSNDGLEAWSARVRRDSDTLHPRALGFVQHIERPDERAQAMVVFEKSMEFDELDLSVAFVRELRENGDV